jgi:hypothetical protein
MPLANLIEGVPDLLWNSWTDDDTVPTVYTAGPCSRTCTLTQGLIWMAQVSIPKPEKGRAYDKLQWHLTYHSAMASFLGSATLLPPSPGQTTGKAVDVGLLERCSGQRRVPPLCPSSSPRQGGIVAICARRSCN